MSEQLQAKEISSVELTQYYLDRIREHDPALNCFITVVADRALKEAEKADHQRAVGNNGLLTGIPLVHKDLFCVKDVKTTCASKMLADFVAPYDATIVRRLNNQGMVCLGKTNMDEFAMGSSGKTSFWGPTVNPWDVTKVAGGSSSGSAAAVAAGLAPAATGSDTGGSIRQPAAFCGVTGFKPTYGRNSRYGMVAFSSSLDQPGTLTRTVEDAKLLFDVTNGVDTKDASTINTAADREYKLPRLTIGYPSKFFEDIPTPLMSVLADVRHTLAKTGHNFKEIELPDVQKCLATYFAISRGECVTNLARFDGIRFGFRSKEVSNIDNLYTKTRIEGFGAEVKRRILFGNYVLTNGKPETHFVKAQKVRRLIHDRYTQTFNDVDFILAPSAPTVAAPVLADDHDQFELYRQDRFTVAANLGGLPAIGVPCGTVNSLPVGIQLIGPRFSDWQLLELAAEYQRLTDWHLRYPSKFL
ncbi:MAG: Asp-tRNA(Asn)/Glu-tRNA(Gln) amidotransferase subunit GatA [Gammaproteobacteria bacterium]|nr:Asp-tRNA(Asn)/Glu-tRNA(Gln) amidotransferase subunit GatA [Gammaproteobacteria bacterium]